MILQNFETNFSTPLSEFVVKKGLRYRFRVINSAAGPCGMRVGNKVL